MTGDGILNNNGNPNNMGNTTKGDIKVYVRDEEWCSYYNDLLSKSRSRQENVEYQNSSKVHASIVLSFILKMANKEYCTLANGFSTSVTAQPYFIRNFRNFIFRGGIFKALLLKPELINERLLDEMRRLKDIFPESIKIRKSFSNLDLYDESNQKMFDDINFAFNDTNAFRVEVDTAENVAFGAFNDTKYIGVLKDGFREINESEKLSEHYEI